MFGRLALNPPVIDLRAFAASVNMPLPEGFVGSLIVIETDWVREPEKADWEYPSREVVTIGHMTFAGIGDAARYLDEGAGRHQNWYQFLAQASRAALKWHNSPEQSACALPPTA